MILTDHIQVNRKEQAAAAQSAASKEQRCLTSR
jgi:hypothetical protein